MIRQRPGNGLAVIRQRPGNGLAVIRQRLCRGLGQHAPRLFRVRVLVLLERGQPDAPEVSDLVTLDETMLRQRH
ncbi:MAG: hypothetical protein A3E01_02485 [Gammaproteobacteria bacterium RIFCSPHIGHO2_12_FULL_63_22]|nr:MAG: hypothetical protein A3E01_02485 [Gammaproteobacteria bacterium RIFCSPHIGHO2_12_FULL_63_22]